MVARRSGAAIVPVYFCIAHLDGSDSSGLRSFIEVRIGRDGALEVTENITVRAEGSNIRRGIYRTFPTRYKDRFGNRVVVDLKVLAVLRNGEPEPWFTEELDNGVRIMVPPHIESGTRIVVDVYEQAYVGKAG